MPYGLYYPRASTQAIYRFDNNLNDSSGNGRTLTCSGTDHYGQDHSRFGTHGIQMDGEYCYIAENFGWDMHQDISIVFWMKVNAGGASEISGSEIIKLNDATYKGAAGLQVVDNGAGTSFNTYTFLYKYDSGTTVVYRSSQMLGGQYNYWCLYCFHYYYALNYYANLYQFDPTGQTNSYADRKSYWNGGVNQAAFTGSGSTSDYFYIGDIAAGGVISIELDEVIVDTTGWNILGAGDELQSYYTKTSSGLWAPKAMF